MLRIEFPEFKRCCYCFPLRLGMLIWGYIKMLPNTLYLSFVVLSFLQSKDRQHDDTSVSPLFIVVMSAISLDLLFTCLFIVAAHLKHEKLYLAYYYYSLICTAVYGIYVIIITYEWACSIYFYIPKVIRHYGMEWSIGIPLCPPLLFIQGYMTLLARSEAIKLAKNAKNINFRFVNHATEATIAMTEATITMTENDYHIVA